MSQPTAEWARVGSETRAVLQTTELFFGKLTKSIGNAQLVNVFDF